MPLAGRGESVTASPNRGLRGGRDGIQLLPRSCRHTVHPSPARTRWSLTRSCNTSAPSIGSTRGEARSILQEVAAMTARVKRSSSFQGANLGSPRSWSMRHLTGPRSRHRPAGHPIGMERHLPALPWSSGLLSARDSRGILPASRSAYVATMSRRPDRRAPARETTPRHCASIALSLRSPQTDNSGEDVPCRQKRKFCRHSQTARQGRRNAPETAQKARSSDSTRRASTPARGEVLDHHAPEGNPMPGRPRSPGSAGLSRPERARDHGTRAARQRALGGDLWPRAERQHRHGVDVRARGGLGE